MEIMKKDLGVIMYKREQIEQSIIKLIINGAVLPGEKLPSVRDLAARHKFSITPVLEALRSLEKKEIIESLPSKGFYVRNDIYRNPHLSFLQEDKAQSTFMKFEILNSKFSNYAANILDPSSHIHWPMASTITSTYYYPVDEINYHIARIAKTQEITVNLQQQPKDLDHLVQNIMKWMIPCGCPFSNKELSLVCSATQALMLALRSCTFPGDIVAVESPGHIGFYFLLEFLQLKALRIPSDFRTGLKVSVLKSYLEKGLRPSCLLLSANYSNPTGALMPEQSKSELVELCRQFRLPIIEDDILGDIHFDEVRPHPLKSFDPENVIYISGFTKSLSPAHRIAWIAGGRFHKEIVFHKNLIGAFVPLLIQQGFSSFLSSGAGARHLQHFRQQCFEILSKSLQVINDTFPSGTIAEMPRGGLFIWIQLPQGIDTALLSDIAKQHDITIASGKIFSSPAGEYNNCIRVNCLAMPWNVNTLEKLSLLGKIATSLIRKN